MKSRIKNTIYKEIYASEQTRIIRRNNFLDKSSPWEGTGTKLLREMIWVSRFKGIAIKFLQKRN